MQTPINEQGFSRFAENVYSQFGEDGILRAILDHLPDTDHWCVEFGAWDGIHLSNTFNLIKNHQYRAVLIEANTNKFIELKKNMEPYSATIINTFVTFDGPTTLDGLLSQTKIPSNFDLLSIDIDGNDYWILESISLYKPKIICIEYNSSMPNDIDYVQPRDFSIKRGSSPKSICDLALSKGYELVATTKTNLIFVHNSLYQYVELPDNKLTALRDDSLSKVYIFTGYDGTVILSDRLNFFWHSIEVSQEELQILPPFLRRFRSDYNLIQKFLYFAYLFFRKPRKAFTLMFCNIPKNSGSI